MGRIFKKRVRKVDPVSGKVTHSLSKKYFAEYRDHKGKKRRKAASTDKVVASQILRALEAEADRRRAGLHDPYEEHRRRPVAEHLLDFERHLKLKGSTPAHVAQVAKRARDAIAYAGVFRLADLRVGPIQDFLAKLRTDGRSAQTVTFYGKAAAQFCRWLVRDRRLPENPLVGLTYPSVQIDRRHDRRAFQPQEFERLLTAAENGPPIEGVSGQERRVIYLVGAWTGLRRRELASLDRQSFDLDGELPSVKVGAAYSKNGRADQLPLHDYLVRELKAWFSAHPISGDNQPMFSLRTKTGRLRRTSAMLVGDMNAARRHWIAEADGAAEQERRKRSDFLRYCTSGGLFADFHSLRHEFITRLAQANVHPKAAQKLARHSSITLTLDRYSHLGLEEAAKAIRQLDPPIVAAKLPSQAHPVEVAEVSNLEPQGVQNEPHSMTRPDNDLTSLVRFRVDLIELSTARDAEQKANDGNGLGCLWPFLTPVASTSFHLLNKYTPVGSNH